MSAPIRQPLPPPLSSYSSSSSTNSNGRTTPTQPHLGFGSPPTADQPADLRRNKTLSHSAHGARWARSGSLSSHAKPVVQEEEGEVAVRQPDTWPENKGLVRQSSLPHRRGKLNIPTSLEALSPPPDQVEPAPPRPPRRVQRSAYPPSSTNFDNANGSQGITRAQSLRAQASGLRAMPGGLGRSSSLRSGEPHPPRPSPPASPSTHASGSPRGYSPPPMSSTAALPPSAVPYLSQDYRPPTPETHSPVGGGIKRHQSLTHGYGANSRVRDRLERSPALLTLEQRRLRDSQGQEDAPPTSPVGPSVWSSDQSERADDGWRQALPQRNLMAMMNSQQPQLHESFEAMNLRGSDGLPGGRPTPAKKLSLITDTELLPDPQQSMHSHHGSLSAAPAVPPIGHSAETASVMEPSWVTSLIGGGNGMMLPPHNDNAYAHRAMTSVGENGMGWAERDALLAAAGLARPGQPTVPWTGTPNMSFHYQQQQQLPPGMMMHTNPGPYMYGQQRVPKPMHQFGMPGPYQQPPGPVELPADQQAEVIELAKAKGLNPSSFDCLPPFARFFVIKSYTEEDVHKSLKHEIWSSTALGNQRLDKAFKESAGRGPIYLFFSVNASGHFCGVAQMLTQVDYNTTSNVWAQDKWKGIFKVKWIFVRDVPNNSLRHIKLLNTAERKPITNSRDTQELLYEAGSQVLSIFLDFQDRAKTSLLQDFTYYEELEANRASQSNSQSATPPPLSAPSMTPQFSNGPMPPMPPIPAQYMMPPQSMPGRGYQQQPGGPAPMMAPPGRRTPSMGTRAF